LVTTLLQPDGRSPQSALEWVKLSLIVANVAIWSARSGEWIRDFSGLGSECHGEHFGLAVRRLGRAVHLYRIGRVTDAASDGPVNGAGGFSVSGFLPRSVYET
jgi:hypothetical protein